MLDDIKSTVAGLRSNHMMYFQLTVEAREVVEFIISQKGFDEKVRFLNGDLQGYVHSSLFTMVDINLEWTC